MRGEPIFYRRSRLKLPGFEPRGAIVAELNLGEGEFRVIAAHLGLFRLSRVDQAGALLTAFLDLPPMPTILLGDLNEWRRRRRSALGGLEPTFGVAPSILSFPLDGLSLRLTAFSVGQQAWLLTWRFTTPRLPGNHPIIFR